MDALPPDAAVFRSRNPPPAEALLAVLIEQNNALIERSNLILEQIGAWSQAIVLAVRGREVHLPPVYTTQRPAETKQVETDPNRIKQFFAKTG